MSDDHEVNEMKAFLLAWLIRFGHTPVNWSDIKEIVGEHKFATWSFCVNEKYLAEVSNGYGYQYKLSKKAMRFLNEQRS